MIDDLNAKEGLIIPCSESTFLGTVIAIIIIFIINGKTTGIPSRPILVTISRHPGFVRRPTNLICAYVIASTQTGFAMSSFVTIDVALINFAGCIIHIHTD